MITDKINETKKKKEQIEKRIELIYKTEKLRHNIYYSFISKINDTINAQRRELKNISSKFDKIDKIKIDLLNLFEEIEKRKDEYYLLIEEKLNAEDNK